MNQNYKHFIDLLDKEEKDKAILYIHKLLEEKTPIVKVYQDFLIPSLANYECDSNKE